MPYDNVIKAIAEYAKDYSNPTAEALETARWCLADSLGCALLALNFPACTILLGPVVPGATLPNGCHVPGTAFQLDPVRGAFNLGTMIRWLDYNDTWLAKEWGHPSDNLGGILATADYLSRNGKPLTMQQVLLAVIKAHEIQGVLALSNSFNRVGLDHVILVRIATTAVVTDLLGGTTDQIQAAVSQAFVDGAPLRAYRHAPNTGSRKSWAAGDATSRGVQLALMSLQGEMGYASALTTPQWGFQDVFMKGQPITLERELGCYVMENVLFKVAFPAEFHAQTAVEAAVQLHPQVHDRLKDIKSITIKTHESAVRIIDKKGRLYNPADRDHCIQYMVAIGLLHGGLTAHHYEDAAASDPRIDALRNLMVVEEDSAYSRDYLDPSKRSIANAVTIHFKDGSSTETVLVEFPLGHRRRRKEAIPLLIQKFEFNASTRLPKHRIDELVALFKTPNALLAMPVNRFMEYFRDTK